MTIHLQYRNLKVIILVFIDLSMCLMAFDSNTVIDMKPVTLPNFETYLNNLKYTL